MLPFIIRSEVPEWFWGRESDHHNVGFQGMISELKLGNDFSHLTLKATFKDACDCT